MERRYPADRAPRPRACREQVFAGEPPIIEEGDLRLRAPAVRDVAAIRTAYADPEVIRWFGVPEIFDARRFVTEEAPRDWRLGVEAVFVVAGARDDAYLGGVDLRVSHSGVGEVGFLVAPWARGHGVATAAVRMITRWGFDAVGLQRIQWRAEVGNDVSRRVAIRAGFRMEGVAPRTVGPGGRRCDSWIGSIVSTER